MTSVVAALGAIAAATIRVMDGMEPKAGAGNDGGNKYEVGDNVPSTGVPVGYSEQVNTGQTIRESSRRTEILERVGPVAYRMTLPPHLSNLHDVFHVSQLQKYTPNASHVLEPESVQLKKDLTLLVTPVRIDDKSIKKLRRKDVLLVKVASSRADVGEHTWELESETRADYPHLFSGN
ncbi:uncharacterized protein [Arachis hypogaea]|uniref:uncharacterized protein n=1 Tax=Arachis hypogaea TaxID=3818 RepID=UPI000DEC0FD4|nr:uncharacterized protein LOC112743812 [Arachis hypogaea]